MPQGRIILKSICQSKKLAGLKTDGARLLYTWLIPNVDINGCFSGDPEVIKGQIFTRLKKSTKTILGYIGELADAGLIIWYESNGDSFLHIPDFVEKQPSLNPEREAKPTIPLPPPDEIQMKSCVTPLKVKERKVKERKEKDKVKKLTPPSLSEINSYIQEKGYQVDGQKFFDYFTESGWVDSAGKPVRNWKQKVITWSGLRKSKGNDNVGTGIHREDIKYDETYIR